MCLWALMPLSYSGLIRRNSSFWLRSDKQPFDVKRKTGTSCYFEGFKWKKNTVAMLLCDPVVEWASRHSFMKKSPKVRKWRSVGWRFCLTSFSFFFSIPSANFNCATIIWEEGTPALYWEMSSVSQLFTDPQQAFTSAKKKSDVAIQILQYYRQNDLVVVQMQMTCSWLERSTHTEIAFLV